MPFKSKAQRRKFAELLVKGEISPETYEEWSRETGDAVLPERAPRKRRPRRRAAKKGLTARKKGKGTRVKRTAKRGGKRKSRSSVRKSTRGRKARR